MKTETEVLSIIRNWAKQNDLIRTVALTGSRSAPHSRIDFLSDFDIELYVTTVRPFLESDDWLNYFGEVMVRWPLTPKHTFDEQWITRLVIFKGGMRIDFQIADQEITENARSGNGYKVLVDKDNKAKRLKLLTVEEYNIKKPSEEEYVNTVNDFWWDATYVPKYLWRDELPFAKYMMDYALRFNLLHKMIDWTIGYDHGWNVNTGLHSKRIKEYLPTSRWLNYEQTFSCSDIEDNWRAFFKMTDLFSELSVDLGEKMGYPYPLKMEQDVREYCLNIYHRR